MKRRPPIFLTLLFVALPALLLVTACGDDDPPSSPGNQNQNPYAAATPEVLLEERLAQAYIHHDSTAYEALFDSLYQFELLMDTTDVTHDFWDLADELRIAGRMFSGWTNPDGIKVVVIDLRIIFQGKSAVDPPLPDQPEGEIWYKAITVIELTILTQDPSASDGSGMVRRGTLSYQDFVVRPDPDDSDSWVIRLQTDKDPITKTGSGAATEDTAWGAIKELFR